MTEAITKKNNVTWFNGYVSREDRETLHGHKGAVIWFTGLSASGKSTIAHLNSFRMSEATGANNLHRDRGTL